MNKVAVSFLLFTLLSGCKPVENIINEIFNQGTARGLVKCIELNNTEIVSLDAIRMSCTKTIDEKIPYSQLSLTAEITSTSPLYFSVLVDNMSTEYIMTRGIVNFYYIKDDIVLASERKEILFDIQPSQSGVERVYITGDLSNVDARMFCGDKIKTRCFSWDIDAFGVTVR